MRLRPTIGGIAILAIGLLLVTYGARSYMAEVRKQEVGTAVTTTTFIVGEFHFIESMRLAANVTVSGRLSVRIPISGEKGDIDFLVLDRTNFQKWQRRDKDVYYLIRKERIDDLNFSFSTEHSDNYYFIFDNTYSILKKAVTFDASFRRIVTVLEERRDHTLNYIGGLIGAIGGMITLYGITKKPVIPWA